MIQHVRRRIVRRITSSHPERSAAEGYGGGGTESKDPVPRPDNPATAQAPDFPPSATGSYWVYILTNDRQTTLYIGITNSLSERLAGHHSCEHDGFSKRHNLTRLIYYENFSDPGTAIAREKQLKGWTRAKKVALISKMNPGFADLAIALFGVEWDRTSAVEGLSDFARAPSTPHGSLPPAPGLPRSAQDDS